MTACEVDTKALYVSRMLRNDRRALLKSTGRLPVEYDTTDRCAHPSVIRVAPRPDHRSPPVRSRARVETDAPVMIRAVR